MPRDIIVTWPKSRPLSSYLDTLTLAREAGDLINYRVSRLPAWPDAITDHGWTSWPFGVPLPRCYVVHDGAVRGWSSVVGSGWREDGEVLGWPAGKYIVRDPGWNPVEPIPMEGFRGWRWFEPPQQLRAAFPTDAYGDVMPDAFSFFNKG